MAKQVAFSWTERLDNEDKGRAQRWNQNFARVSDETESLSDTVDRLDFITTKYCGERCSNPCRAVSNELRLNCD